jgi:hypothetical protein
MTHRKLPERLLSWRAASWLLFAIDVVGRVFILGKVFGLSFAAPWRAVTDEREIQEAQYRK